MRRFAAVRGAGGGWRRATLCLALASTFVAVFGGPHSIAGSVVTPLLPSVTITGASPNDMAGVSVSSAGDVNGDGRDDVIIGAYGVDGRGAAYVIFGTAAPTDIALGTLGNRGFVITGAAANDAAGVSVAGAGDVNGDGYADVIVGANSAGSFAGAAYVVFGSPSPSSVSLGALGTRGFVINGAADPRSGPGTGGRFGDPVAAAGDVNGDGLADVIVGAPLWTAAGDILRSTTARGAAYVVYGSRTPSAVSAAALGSAGFAITGAAADSMLGIGVAGAGDVNGDGHDDVIVGASGENAKAGAAYVVYGAASPTTVSVDALGGRGFSIAGAAPGDQAGADVHGAGDVNADGRDDVIVGADGANGQSGAAYVVFGSRAPTGVSLGALGANGFTMGGAVAGDHAGIRVGSGDVNGDGRSDLIVGAYGVNAQAGAAYVVYGADAPSDVSFGALGDRGAVLDGGAPAGSFGVGLSGAGDLTGDGVDDLLVGAVAANGRAGEAYVVNGIAAGPRVTTRGTIAGQPILGRNLAGNPGDWANQASLTFTRQWRRCNARLTACDPIAGATGATYAITDGDVGGRLEMVVRATDPAGRSTVSRTSPSVIVLAPPRSTVVPRVRRSGTILRCSAGTWLYADRLAFRWRRNGVAVRDATAARYRITAHDRGRSFVCRVTAANPVGTASAVSRAFRVR